MRIQTTGNTTTVRLQSGEAVALQNQGYVVFEDAPPTTPGKVMRVVIFRDLVCMFIALIFGMATLFSSSWISRVAFGAVGGAGYALSLLSFDAFLRRRIR